MREATTLLHKKYFFLFPSGKQRLLGYAAIKLDVVLTIVATKKHPAGRIAVLLIVCTDNCILSYSNRRRVGVFNPNVALVAYTQRYCW